MSLRDSIKKVLNEALGVPSGIVDVANKVYDKLLDSISDNSSFDDLDKLVLELRGKLTISDYKFKGIDIEINLVENNDIDMVSMSTKNRSRITKKFKLEVDISKKVLDIVFLIAAPKTITGKDIKKYLVDDKIEIVSSLSHELKHYYDNFKKPKKSAASRARYTSLTQHQFADITPINEFMYYLYYVHTIENLVRPSEIAGGLDAGKISKKDFLKFLNENRVYQTLKSIQKFTYEGLKKELLDYFVPRIKGLFDSVAIDYDNLSDEEIVDKLLKLVLINLSNWQADQMTDILMTNPIEQLFGFSGKKGEFFSKYLKKIGRFGEDYKRYFEYEEKMFKFVATKMIKKISKLYDMASDVKNESIINWKLWHKIKGTDATIVTENRYLKEGANYPLPLKHPIVQSLFTLIDTENTYSDYFTLPYSDNEDGMDVDITYHVDKISLWKEGDTFTGTIYITVDSIKIGNRQQDQWEEGEIDDVPSWVIEDVEENILSKVETWGPNVDVDIQLKHSKNKD